MSFMRSAVALGQPALSVLEEHPRMNLQGSRNASKHLNGRIAFATLNAAEMSHCDSGRFGELRLRKGPLLADATSVQPDNLFPISHLLASRWRVLRVQCSAPMLPDESAPTTAIKGAVHSQYSWPSNYAGENETTHAAQMLLHTTCVKE
jgi:hypothetical protein